MVIKTTGATGATRPGPSTSKTSSRDTGRRTVLPIGVKGRHPAVEIVVLPDDVLVPLAVRRAATRRKLDARMYPFWDRVVWPVLQATRARRIVEIGALRGETTALMLERLGPDTELHVIDPVPEFDPAEHEKKFPGRYIFHRDVSHNVLPTLPAVDVALVDGDHNWFTVYHELQMLERDRAPRRRAAARADHARRAAGRTAAATSTTCPSASPRSSASPTR